MDNIFEVDDTKTLYDKQSLLSTFGKDLTDMASKGLLDPVIGRDKEINDVIQVLNKRKKNNPLIVGEPGVGKTSIIEGLAIKIANKDVDIFLMDKKIIEINLNAMVSGSKFRGDFEKRIEDLIEETKKNPNILIFIDEIHNIVGAGSTSGSMDASNIIKPALSKGDMRCIGATTLDEYKKHLEGEGAFDRRFQKIYIKEPSIEETENILLKIKDKYENYHNVKYDNNIIKKCVDYSNKYINSKKFPDKAIDLLDEVGSMVKLKNIKKQPNLIISLEKSFEDAKQKKVISTSKQDFENAARYRDLERSILGRISEEKKKYHQELKKNKKDVCDEDVLKIISIHTGIPVNELTVSENEKLLSFSDIINNDIIGQQQATLSIQKTLQRSMLGLHDPNKPMASFLFLGPTGVGKTMLAKLLAKHYFNTSDSFIKIDMSEYDEKHSVSKFIGAPAGYVGYDDNGQLTERIKNRPYSLVLFDEVEKAHPDVFNLFLQILDDGKLTDSKGYEVSFKNTIIIMTSNIGTKGFIENKPLGFGSKNKEMESVKDNINKELKRFFKPEFLNRIDEKIIFNPLSIDDIRKISKLELDIVLDRIKEKGYNISFDKNVINLITEKGYDKDFGARPIKRYITDNIINTISEKILKKEIVQSQKYKLKIKDNTIIISKINVRNKSR